jgi:hypothetical protein
LSICEQVFTYFFSISCVSGWQSAQETCLCGLGKKISFCHKIEKFSSSIKRERAAYMKNAVTAIAKNGQNERRVGQVFRYMGCSSESKKVKLRHDLHPLAVAKQALFC